MLQSANFAAEPPGEYASSELMRSPSGTNDAELCLPPDISPRFE